MNRPWIDVQSVNEFERFRKKVVAPVTPTTMLDKARAKLVDRDAKIKKSRDEVNEFVRLIAAYHEIPKSELNLFSTRSAKLRVIRGRAELCMKLLEEEERDQNTNSNLPTSLRPELKAAVDRAAAKAEYLDTLRDYYSANHNLASTTGLIEFFKAAPTKAEQGTVPLRDVHRLEPIDPYHRDFEIKQSADGTQYKADSAIGRAFLEWFAEVSIGKNVPHFYLWFENHPLCTNPPGTPYQISNDENEGFAPINVHGITYTHEDVLLLECNSSVVRQHAIVKSGGLADWELFDTQGAKSKEKDAFAYVFTRAHELVSAPHIQGEIHHSTLAKGRAVLCAGMISAVMGKIVLISNDSGHYQPPKTALHELVLRLVQASVFADNAMVKYFVPEKRKYETVTVQVFLQPSKPVAETSPAVPSSQAANSTWTPGRVHGNHVAIGGHRR